MPLDRDQENGQAQPNAYRIVAVAIVVLALVVLREILPRFVAVVTLAYLLDPVADRIERLGVGRAVAAIVSLFIVGVTALRL